MYIPAIINYNIKYINLWYIFTFMILKNKYKKNKINYLFLMKNKDY